MSQPTQTCMVCGRVQTVTPDGRGFPPDIAKRKLAKLCKADGHVSRPQYRVGMAFAPPGSSAAGPWRGGAS